MRASMLVFLGLGFLASSVFPGCSGRHGESVPVPRDEASVAQSNAVPAGTPLSSVAEAPPPVAITNTQDSNAVLEQLSASLRRYVVATRTAPASFEEFATKSHLQAPSPPAGKKYVIRGGAVVLSNR